MGSDRFRILLNSADATASTAASQELRAEESADSPIDAVNTASGNSHKSDGMYLTHPWLIRRSP